MPTSSRRTGGGGGGGHGGAAAFSSPLYFGSTFASSSSSSFSSYSSSSTSSAFLDHHHHHHQHQRSTSPTRVHFVGSSPPRRSSTVSFSLDRSRPAPPGRSLPAVVDRRLPPFGSAAAASTRSPGRRTCMCSPTSHPGSFRCSLHKGLSHNRHHPHHGGGGAASSPSNRLNARRSAMANSLVRIGTVEGEWVRRALSALIRPSSHQQRRRLDFQPRPSRLSVLSMADGP